MALERVQQDHQLENAAIATIWRGKAQRGRKAYVYAVVISLRGIEAGPERFASWEEAEAWVRRTAGGAA